MLVPVRQLVLSASTLVHCIGCSPATVAGAGQEQRPTVQAGPSESAKNNNQVAADDPTATSARRPSKPEQPAGNPPADACQPLPKEGTPCVSEAGFCVISWGEPGGYSEALWCVDGRWEIEREANLP